MEDQKLFDELNRGNWKEVVYDSCTEDWQKHWFLDGKVAKVINSEDGMLFEAGDTFLEESHHGVLWSEEVFEGDLKIEYEFTRMDNETRCVNILYIQAQGIGEAPYTEDVKEWSDLREIPLMRWYFEKMHTYHVSYAAFENNDEVTPGYIRCRRYMGGPLDGTDVLPDYEPGDFFAYGVPHQITLIKKDQTLYFHIKNPEREKLCVWMNDLFPPITKGRIGLRQMFTRISNYKDIRISVPAKEA